MQSSKLKKMKKALVLSSVYMLLSAMLLLCISTAKYTDSRLAYTSYGAASFNSVILGDCTDGTINAFGKTVCAKDCVPGMTYDSEEENNTAKFIPFSVANGTTADNVSEATVSYTIRLRSTRNIPLLFSLSEISGTGESRTRTVYKAEKPVRVSGESASDSGPAELEWYEWVFQVESSEAEQDAQPLEKSFTLEGGGDTAKNMPVRINSHELVVEWPITEKEEGETPDNSTDYMKETPDNSTDYMKEIDLLEVVVTVSSRNNIKADPEEYEEIVLPADALYGRGIIILAPKEVQDAEGTDYPYHYSYPVDLRAFHADPKASESTDKVYDFTVTNGAGMGISQTGRYTDYIIEVKTPYTVVYTDEDTKKTAAATKDFKYELFVSDSVAGVYTSTVLTGSELRLYEELVNPTDEQGNPVTPNTYGTYTVVSDPSEEELLQWTKEDSPQRLYKVYTFKAGADAPFHLLNQVADNTGKYVDRAASLDYRLVLDTGAVNIDTETAFENKLEITVKAVMTDTNSSGQDSGESGGGGQ